MVNKHNEEHETDLETTNDGDLDQQEPELADLEEASGTKIKQLQQKIARLKEEKKQLMDDAQRAKAEFLNIRRRLEEERAHDRVRHQKEHVMQLLPLCDSFQMAIDNNETWEKADAAWRTGVEAIYGQLKQILESYRVTALNPVGEPFNPHKHEAVGTEVVTDEQLQDTVISVVQKGYEMAVGDTKEIIRPARVTTGIVN